MYNTKIMKVIMIAKYLYLILVIVLIYNNREK